MIQQYVPMPDGDMVPHATGGYVAYADHLAEIAAKDAQLLLLAKLAAKTPQFFNPMEAWAAETLRDEILKRK